MLANASPIGLAVLEVPLPPLPELSDALLEVAVLEVPLPPLPELSDGCAGPIKALFEPGLVLGIYLL